jgi:ubiquinone/menaquinone biosynthesis C-methylase UbiE
MTRNVDERTVAGFGDEWTRFDQSEMSAAELQRNFEAYFALLPWERLKPDAQGFDMGCGSGRWAKVVAPRVGKLHCVDASADALSVARQNLKAERNVEFHHASVDNLPFADGSMDFAYSLGVLHHVPDTASGIAACARKLKPGAPLLLYLYYRFDNKPAWFRGVWRVSEVGRRVISRMPHGARYLTSQLIASTVYWPLARTAKVLERAHVNVSSLPLSSYRDASFYSMRTDALDRFGTRLEQRFTRAEIAQMMTAAGLVDVKFSERGPYWCAIGYRR